MAFTEDLSVFLADFGVSVTAGAVSGSGLLDMPGELIADGMVITTDYTLRCEASKFGNLIYGAGITVNGTLYTVRDNRRLDDGAFVEIALQKTLTDDGLVTDQVVDGGDPSSIYGFTVTEENVWDGGTP
jgi:hypothetical protein